MTEDQTRTLSMNMIIYRFSEMMDEKEDLPKGAMSRNRSNTRHLGEGKEKIQKQPSQGHESSDPFKHGAGQ